MANNAGNERHGKQIVYAAIPFYPLNQLFAKFSILLLYYRLFSVKRSFVRWTYVLGTAQAADTVLTLAINLLGCHPVSLFWESLGRGWCLDQILVFAGTESINSAVDFAMVALASIMVSGIQLNLHTKLKLILLFVVGGLYVVSTVPCSMFTLRLNWLSLLYKLRNYWMASHNNLCI
jgi:hypothetical protein